MFKSFFFFNSFETGFKTMVTLYIANGRSIWTKDFYKEVSK